MANDYLQKYGASEQAAQERRQTARRAEEDERFAEVTRRRELSSSLHTIERAIDKAVKQLNQSRGAQRSRGGPWTIEDPTPEQRCLLDLVEALAAVVTIMGRG